jgi:hypothetical protein
VLRGLVLPSGPLDGALRPLVLGLEADPVGLIVGHEELEHPLHDRDDRRMPGGGAVLREDEQRA